jgi:GTP cyclohydrolase I
MKMNNNEIETHIRAIIDLIGEDINREGLLDTPKRVARMYEEIFRGYDKFKLPKVTSFNNGSDGITYDEMIVDEGDFYSMCEHHMMPFFGKYYFAYIPNPKGKILGLSKVARVVDFFSAKLQIQERLVKEVVDYIWNELSKDGIEPLGMALLIRGEHLCKTMRGVKKKGIMTSTELRGVLKTDSKAREEFLMLVK